MAITTKQILLICVIALNCLYLILKPKCTLVLSQDT